MGDDSVGLIDALYTIGKEFSSKTSDIADYLSLPMVSGKEIRVYLSVANIEDLESEEDKPLQILGVSKIDVADFLSGIGSDEEKKERYLYKDPPGSNTSWRYSPLLRLGKPKKDMEKNRVAFFEGEKSYIEKIKNMLYDFEKMKYSEKGSTEKVINGLIEQGDRILECFSDKDSSYIIIFGIDRDGEFIYPGEVDTFRRYFSEKLKGSLSVGKDNGINRCNYCGEEATSFVNFDEIFPFATFDKPNFLPAINKNFSNKVYMICDKCHKVFQNSTTYVQSHFTDKSIIYGIQIWVIPEFFTVDENTFDRSFRELKDYFLTDKSSKEELLDYITDESTIEEFTSVFHFVFVEQNQAQLIIHRMIEDVPITRIRKLKGIWEHAVDRLGYQFDKKLSTALKTVYRVLNNLVMKEESEAKVMRDLAVNTIGQILSAEMVDTSLLKREFVSRIPKLMNNDQKKSQFNFILNDFLLLNEFLSKYNSSLGGLI